MHTVRVWDLPTRLFHWSLVLCVVGLIISGNIGGNAMVWHFRLGYAVFTLLLFRLVYGLVGPRQARLSGLWRRASGLGDWLRAALAGQPGLTRFVTLGMGAAMLLLLLVAAPLVLSGYAGHVDWLGMEDALEEVHEFFANSAMALVLMASVFTNLGYIYWYRSHRRQISARNLFLALLADVAIERERVHAALVALRGHGGQAAVEGLLAGAAGKNQCFHEGWGPGWVACSRVCRKCRACQRSSPHMAGSGASELQTAGRSGRPKSWNRAGDQLRRAVRMSQSQAPAPAARSAIWSNSWVWRRARSCS